MEQTIEISSDAAADIIPCLESRVAALDEQIAHYTMLRDRARTTLAEVRGRLTGNELPLVNGKYPQRRPKGYWQEVILNLLATGTDGHGLTISDIEKRTGVNHSTAFRTLKIGKQYGVFVKSHGKWKTSHSPDFAASAVKFLEMSGKKAPVALSFSVERIV